MHFSLIAITSLALFFHQIVLAIPVLGNGGELDVAGAAKAKVVKGLTPTLARGSDAHRQRSEKRGVSAYEKIIEDVVRRSLLDAIRILDERDAVDADLQLYTRASKKGGNGGRARGNVQSGGGRVSPRPQLKINPTLGDPIPQFRPPPLYRQDSIPLRRLHCRRSQILLSEFHAQECCRG